MKHFVFLAMLLLSTKLLAQVTVSPMEVLADMKPGETRSFDITLFNGMAAELEPLTFKVQEYLNIPGKNQIDAKAVRAGKKPSHDFSILPFAKASKTSVDPIKPKKADKVTITVTIPKDYNKGVGYFTYSIEPSLNSALMKKKNTFRTITGFYGRVFVNITGIQPESKVDLKEVSINKNGSLQLNFQNIGQKFLEVVGDVTVLDKDNKQIGKFNLSSVYNEPLQLMLPNKENLYGLKAMIPNVLINPKNKILVTIQDPKRNYVESFLKEMKVK